MSNLQDAPAGGGTVITAFRISAIERAVADAFEQQGAAIEQDAGTVFVKFYSNENTFEGTLAITRINVSRVARDIERAMA